MREKSGEMLILPLPPPSLFISSIHSARPRQAPRRHGQPRGGAPRWRGQPRALSPASRRRDQPRGGAPGDAASLGLRRSPQQQATATSLLPCRRPRGPCAVARRRPFGWVFPTLCPLRCSAMGKRLCAPPRMACAPPECARGRARAYDGARARWSPCPRQSTGAPEPSARAPTRRCPPTRR
jgi:hypothetical protein